MHTVPLLVIGLVYALASALGLSGPAAGHPGPAMEMDIKRDDDPFQGRISYVLEQGDQRIPFVYIAKEDRARVELTHPRFGGEVAVLYNKNLETMHLLFENLGAFMSISNVQPPADSPGDAETLEATGNSRSFAGISGSEYRYRQPEGDVTLWAADDASFERFYFPTMGAEALIELDEVLQEVLYSGTFPLLVEAEHRKFRLEAVEAETGYVPDALFNVPDEYEQMELPGGGQPDADFRDTLQVGRQL